MASVLTMSAHISMPAAEPSNANGLRCSSASLLSASGSFPILAAMFVEEAAVEVATEIAIHLSLSQSIPVPALVEQVVAAEPKAQAHVNPAKPAEIAENAVETALAVADAAAVASPVAVVAAVEADVDEYAVPVDEYDDRWDDDGWGDDDRDYDLLERVATHAFKMERRKKGPASVPLRATKENKNPKEPSPTKRVGHRLKAKMDRSVSRKLENRLAHKHGRPPPVYWQPDERRMRSQEERDLEEALRRSRREGHISTRLTVQSLLDLQNRELTPEDYEMLLLLDETVEKKKISKDTFAGYPQTILTADLPTDCPICMCPMATGEKVTTLPCSHQYHTPCIEQWLTNSSPNCPLDGLSLLH